MRYAMLALDKVIQIVNAEEKPMWPPTSEGVAISAKECEDETVEAGMYYDSKTDTYYIKDETEQPSEQDLLQAEMLLNQAEMINKQSAMDETLAHILLNQMGV